MRGFLLLKHLLRCCAGHRDFVWRTESIDFIRFTECQPKSPGLNSSLLPGFLVNLLVTLVNPITCLATKFKKNIKKIWLYGK